MESLNTNSVSNIASSVPEDDEILVKPNWLKNILTQTLIPSFCLHSSIISSILLYDIDTDIFSLFVPFYCITLALIFFHALRVKEYKTNIDSSRVVNALFCFSILTVISFLIFIDIINPKFMPTIMLTTLIGGAYIMVLLLYIIEKIQPLSLVVIGIYSAVFYHFLYNDKSFFTVAAFTLTCYALGALALIKKKHFSYLVGYIFGGMTILLLESEDIQQQIWTLIFFAMAILLILIIYELAMGRSKHSDFVGFLIQGCGVFVIFITIQIALKQISIADTAMATLVVFTIYSIFMFLKSGINGLVSRIIWLILLSNLWIADYENGNDYPSFINSVSIFLIFASSILFRNQFARLSALFFIIPHIIIELISLDTSIKRGIRNFTTQYEESTYSRAELDLFQTTSNFLLFATAIIIAMLIASYSRPTSQLAWWRGLIKPRHVVVIRSIYRTISDKIRTAPIIGWFFNAFLATLTSIRFIKGNNEKVSVYDFLLVILHVIAAIGTTKFSNILLLGGLSINDIDTSLAWSEMVSFVLSWSLWGLLLSIRGYLQSSLFFSFLGFVFLCVPIIRELFFDDLIEGMPEFTGILVLIMLSTIPIFLISLLPERSQTKA